MSNENKQIGELAEVKFWLECSKRGLFISKPFGDSAPYDCIVDNGKRLFKVQVKSCNQLIDSKNYKLHVARGRSSKFAYQTNEVDLAACYLIDLDKWYIIPFEALEGKITVNLFPLIENSQGKYEMYNENWNVIE